MDVAHFDTWISTLGRAWEARDPHAAAALFSPDVCYSEDPFGATLHGRAAVFEYWRDETAQHEQIRFEHEVIAATPAACIAHWHTTFVRVGTQQSVTLDGVLVVTFNEQGECTTLREWWHRSEGIDIEGGMRNDE